MGKYRKDKITLGNALKVVEALLILADEEITVPGDKLKATFKLEWVKEDELQVSGTVEQKRKNKIQPVEKGITKDDLWTLVECIGETLELSPSKDGMKRDSPEKRKQAVQDVLDCLTDLKLLEDKRLHGKNDKSGYWKFHLKLKHQTADKKDNLKVIKEKWDDNISSVPDLELGTPTKKSLDWREICQRNLTQQKELTTNPFTNANGISPKLDKVYVPLAIVERKASQPKSNKQPEEAEKETLIPIEEKRFFEEVLRQGKSEISQGRKIAIIGEPGSGKTTRLQKIADWILDQDLGLPIWVSLADLTQGTVYKYIEDLWLTGENLTLDALKPEKNRIWLLLDGLDEMTSKIESRHVSALLGGWLQDARVVVTCRVNVWEADKNAFSGFDVFRNLEFSREQVNQYIGNWFTEIGDAATGENLEKELAKSENLAFNQLIQNPLRLWMLCQIWQTGGGLPDTQAELYRQFVDRVYRWKADEEILDQRSEIDTALARLALAAMEQKEEVSRFQLSESWIVEVLGSRQIFKAVEKLGWLNRIERLPEAIYVFYHATFQEYFAALSVDDWDDFLPRNHVHPALKDKEYRIFQPQWKQVILFWLGRSDVEDKEKEAFIEKLVNFNDGCYGNLYWYRAYFIAAVGISEFKTCSFADAIVRKIVLWGFGYYDENKETWGKFLDPIEESAREILPQTDRELAIQKLCQILQHTNISEFICKEVIITLGKIGQNNFQAIKALIRVIETTTDESISMEAAASLGKIDPGNPQAIETLVRVIKINTDEDTYYKINTDENTYDPEVIEILGEIGKGNSQAKKALIEVIETTEDEFISMEAAASLGKIDPGNPQAIETLVRVIKNTANEPTRRFAVKRLEKIHPGNPQAILELLQVLKTSTDKDILMWTVFSLEEIGQGNLQAIKALVKIVKTTTNEFTRMAAASCLGKIDPGNPQAIETLVKVIQTTTDQYTRWRAIHSLGEIGKGNQKAIEALLRVLKTTLDESSYIYTAENLGKIDPGNPQAIETLVKFLEPTEDEDTRSHAAESLGKIDPGNPQAIETLVIILKSTINKFTNRYLVDSLRKIGKGNLQVIEALVRVLKTTTDEFVCSKISNILGEIITTDEHRKSVVAALQPHLNHEIYENNFNLFTNCYEVLWNIAQDLPYPDFYHAWHGPTSISPFVQTLELAQLPKNLQTQLTETNLNQTLQIFYIDGSKFIGDDPAKTIYRQMTQQGSPKIDEKPKNMTDLQDYWADLIEENDKHPVLIFYEDPSNRTPQGFRPTFLDMLTRFDGIICLIADETHPPLQTFSPQDPQLIDNIMAWLKRTILEM